jgi:hypothetical protein
MDDVIEDKSQDACATPFAKPLASLLGALSAARIEEAAGVSIEGSTS